MRVAIASRIFEPEPSAASFRLAALATAFTETGDDVEVLTVKPPRGTPENASERVYRVRRFPVLRDGNGYVRGYVQYLSFDVPLFFRILFGRRRDLIVVEPPPTTGFFVRIAARLRATPYAYYAADIWSDASESTGAPGFVVDVVRSIERFALSGARCVFSVNGGVTERVRQIAPRATVHTVGNGVDTSIFTVGGDRRKSGPYLLYVGTASEWQGASIFVDAFEALVDEFPDARIVFVGQGSDWPSLHERARNLPEGAVEFVDTVPPEEAAEWIRGAAATMASIRPGAGYDFAFPTKVFASWSAGAPVIFAGSGSVVEFMDAYRDEADLGASCAYDTVSVVKVMRAALASPRDEQSRIELARWAAERVSLASVAREAVRVVGRPVSDTARQSYEEEGAA